MILFFCYFFFNCYLAFNAKLTVMKRSKKFFENEGIYCFFTFCTDWFSYFWIDWCRSKFDSKGDDKEKEKVTHPPLTPNPRRASSPRTCRNAS